MTKIKIRSTAHRKVPVADILPNPHRDLKANPVTPERIEGLIESYERTGFWDNIVVREHPTREGKFQLAYGHNRLAALKDRRVEIEVITIPVAKLTDWEMYCAMVDENETQGVVTTAIAMENIVVGCELIERVLKKVGPKGTWQEFNETIGSSVTAGTEARHANDSGFERVRDTFFEDGSIGRAFLAEFLPCGKMRSHTISTVINARYAKGRADARTKQAEEKKEEAASTKDPDKKAKLEAIAAKLEKQAAEIGRGVIDPKVLLKFEHTRTMTDFAEAVRKLGITPEFHEEAADYILAAQVKEERIRKELDIFWDKASGAAAKRTKAAAAVAAAEKFRKATEGRDLISVLLGIAEHLKNDEKDIKAIAASAGHLLGSRERRVIEDKIAPVVKILNTIVDRSRAPDIEGEYTVVPNHKLLEQRQHEGTI